VFGSSVIFSYVFCLSLELIASFAINNGGEETGSPELLFLELSFHWRQLWLVW
jgi:hypothetical protein